MRFIALYVFMASLCQAGGSCNPTETEANFRNLMNVLATQARGIEQALDGENSKIVVVQDLFGSGFVFERSDEVIRQIDQELKDPNFVLSEHQFVIDCLLDLGRLQDRERYKQELKKVLNLRSKLIEKNLELGNSLFTTLLENRSLPNLKSQLNDDAQRNKLAKQKLEQDLLKTEASATQDGDAIKRELKGFKGFLTKLKIDLVNKKISQNEKLEKRLIYFTETSNKASQMDADSNLGQVDIYLKIENLWLEVVRDNISELSKFKFSFDLPRLPEEPELLKDLAKEELVEVRNSMSQLTQLRKSTVEELTEKKNKEIKLLSELFIQISKYRSALLKNQSWLRIGKGLFSRR